MIRVLVVLFFLSVPRLSFSQYVISTVAGGVPPATPLAGPTASIGDPPRVAVDAAGNVYFGSVHSVFKVDPSGGMTRIAGTGRYGYSGDGGPATNAQLSYPAGIAIDAAGNLFVADRDASVIRKITPDGTIGTFAGTGTAGSSGDGGPAAQAQFNGLLGLCFDSLGNLYVADTGNSLIRRIAPDGTVSTVLGGQAAGDRQYAQLNGPEGVAVDTAGNLYIADTFNNVVRKLAADGTISVFAGNGDPSFAGDSGPAPAASLWLPTDVAVDGMGNLYIADLGTIRIRMVANGIINTIVGGAKGPPPFDGLAALGSRLKGPTGVAVDSNGTVYFAEGSIGSGSNLNIGDFKVWKVGADGTIATVAGTGLNSFSGDNGPAAVSQVDTPAGMAMDSDGNVYFADSANNRVRKISPDGSITTVAGTGAIGYSGEFVPAVSAQLNHPMGIAVDVFGFLYIADTGNNRVRAVDPSGMIYTVAGNGNAAYYGDGLRAQDAALRGPEGVAVDDSRNIYIADTLNHRVREVTLDGILNTVAGNGKGFGGDGGPGVNALLNLPVGIALDGGGNLFIADQGNGRIRMLSAGGFITTVAGSNGANGLGDGGPAVNAQLKTPQGVAVDATGNLYISDTGQNRVRKVGVDGTINTIGGTGRCCYSIDGISAAIAPLNAPSGIVVDASGNVWFADTGNQAIRRLQPLRAGASGVQTVVANAASNVMGPIAPGEVVAIYGAGLGPASGTQTSGVTVLFNGTPGMIVGASANRITAIVPDTVAGSKVQVSGSYQNAPTFSISVPVAPAAPGLFTADMSGVGQAMATNQDGSANSAARLSPPGGLITVFFTGAGQLPVTATIGGLQAAVQSAIVTSGSGVMQVVVQVPGGIQPGPAVPVVVQAGGTSSPAGVTIAVAGL